jgi:hypothetical protein
MPPLRYPLNNWFYFCDESSFVNDEFMGVAGIVIHEDGIPLLKEELARIRKVNRARGKIKWNTINKYEKQAQIDFIDHFWRLSDQRRIDFHIRFAPFVEYDHKRYKGKYFDTTSRMFYELLLHRAVRNYGKWDRLFIRPDDGDCTKILPHLKAGLNADGVRKWRTNPQCVDSIICLSSKDEPILQFVDVVLGAFTALRNKRSLTGPKLYVADYAMKTLQTRRRDLLSKYSDTRHFSIWNAIPSKASAELDPRGSGRPGSKSLSGIMIFFDKAFSA